MPVNSEANLWAADDTLTTPLSYLVDLSIGRELPHCFSVQFAYVGRFGGHLLTQRDLNSRSISSIRKPGLTITRQRLAYLSWAARATPRVRLPIVWLAQPQPIGMMCCPA